jgi:hypothetical protein
MTTFAALRQRHGRVTPSGQAVCGECLNDWPCDVIRLLDTIEALLDDLRELADRYEQVGGPDGGGDAARLRVLIAKHDGGTT